MIEGTGSSAGFNQSIEYVKPFGTIALLGNPNKKYRNPAGKPQPDPKEKKSTFMVYGIPIMQVHQEMNGNIQWR